VNKLDEKAHLRDSIRMTRSLKDHLNRETLPSPDNYHPHLLTIGSRATLDELHLGEVYEQKVSKQKNDFKKVIGYTGLDKNISLL
jgi:hypothetical protein